MTASALGAWRVPVAQDPRQFASGLCQENAAPGVMGILLHPLFSQVERSLKHGDGFVGSLKADAVILTQNQAFPPENTDKRRPLRRIVGGIGFLHVAPRFPDGSKRSVQIAREAHRIRKYAQGAAEVILAIRQGTGDLYRPARELDGVIETMQVLSREGDIA